MATEKQIAALKRAREAKAAKAPTLNKSNPNVFMTEDKVWLEGLVAAIHSLEIKSPVHVKNAVAIADEVLVEYKNKFK